MMAAMVENCSDIYLAKLQSYSEASECSIGTKKRLWESYLASWTIESAVLDHYTQHIDAKPGRL